MGVAGKAEGAGNRGDRFVRVEKDHLRFIDFAVPYVLIESHPGFFAEDGGQILGRYRDGGGYFV